MRSELKLKHLTIEEVAAAVNGNAVRLGGAVATKIKSVTTSSSESDSGSLFTAIKGARVDGHEYIADAVKNGAVAALADHIPDSARSLGFWIILVDDTVAALGKLARYYKSLTDIKTVGVTGSVGKTTTKEFIAAVLSQAYKTHKTEGNHNNEIGVPMMTLAISEDDRASVTEMGMSDFGEIHALSDTVRPDIAVITNIGTAHIANLGSRENICRAKLEIADGMSPSGILLVNLDEPLLGDADRRVHCKVKTFSLFNPSGNYRALNIRTSKGGMLFDIISGNRAVTNIEIPILGQHNVYNALVAFAVGTELGLSDGQIRRGLSTFSGVSHRQNIYDVGGVTVIDDCYNASPESMKAALDVLVSYTSAVGGRPTALLGDMLELGEYSKLMHEQLGQQAAAAQLSALFCYGNMADTVAESAIKKGIRAHKVFVCPTCDTPELMAEMIASETSRGDVLLVKASRGVHAEDVIEALKNRRSPSSEK